MSGYGPCARPRDYLSWLTLVWLHGMLIPLRNSLRAALAGVDKRRLDLPTVDIHARTIIVGSRRDGAVDLA